MMSSVASERSVTQLGCDEHFPSIHPADPTSEIGWVFGNSYIVWHGSYPR